jgi:hypothetical protein
MSSATASWPRRCPARSRRPTGQAAGRADRCGRAAAARSRTGQGPAQGPPRRRHHGHPPAAARRRHLRREDRHRPRRGHPLPRYLRRRRDLPAPPAPSSAPSRGGKPRSKPRKPRACPASPEPVNQVVSRNCQGSPETTHHTRTGRSVHVVLSRLAVHPVHVFGRVRRVLSVRGIPGVVTRCCRDGRVGGRGFSGCWPASAGSVVSASPGWAGGSSAVTGFAAHLDAGHADGNTTRTCQWSGTALWPRRKWRQR